MGDDGGHDTYEDNTGHHGHTAPQSHFTVFSEKNDLILEDEWMGLHGVCVDWVAEIFSCKCKGEDEEAEVVDKLNPPKSITLRAAHGFLLPTVSLSEHASTDTINMRTGPGPSALNVNVLFIILGRL